MRLELTVNGEPVVTTVEARTLLLDLLRDELGLTGAKRSCEVQVCGACTVLVDGGPVSSCCFLAADTNGREVLTIEGFSRDPEFRRYEDAFVRQAAVQCGFCTPGLVLTMKYLRDSGALVDRAAARTELSGNLCRCTGYGAILDVVDELTEESRT